MSRNVDRMFRGAGPHLMSDTDPRQAQRTFDMETIMESRMHPYHCTCADCAPRPVGQRRNWQWIIEVVVMMAAVFAFTVWAVSRP